MAQNQLSYGRQIVRIVAATVCLLLVLWLLYYLYRDFVEPKIIEMTQEWMSFFGRL